MYTAVVIPPVRKRPLELQNYAAQEWNAADAFLQREFANQVHDDATKRGAREQVGPEKKGWAFRRGRSVPQHK